MFVGTSVCGEYAPASGCQGLGQDCRAWDLCLVPRKLKGAWLARATLVRAIPARSQASPLSSR